MLSGFRCNGLVAILLVIVFVAVGRGLVAVEDWVKDGFFLFFFWGLFNKISLDGFFYKENELVILTVVEFVLTHLICKN